MRTRPLIWFFLLAYAVTWLLWAPVVILGLPVFSESTHAPSLYMLPGVAVGVTGSAFLHGSVDGTATYLQVLADKGVISKAAAATTVDAGLLIACVVFALLVLLATRGRLSYRRYHDAAEQLDVVQPAR